jgi:alpha-L-rhamnosidase
MRLALAIVVSAFLGSTSLAENAVPVGADELARGFAVPPASSRPWVYWFPLSGNLTKEGITADLEAMARVGIGGVLYMEVDQGAPRGSADFAGPLWRSMLKHACHEAHRLGLEINMNNDAGWCGSGGPWIRPELSMQKVVWSETVIDGGRRFTGSLSQPPTAYNYYRDIVVLAMPAPQDKFRIAEIGGKASFHKQDFPPQPATYAKAPAEEIISRRAILDLSARMDTDGHLSWNAPPGKWLVLRFGHTSTGKDNHPAPASGRGLECDKFSTEAATIHFNNLMGRLIAENKDLAGVGKTLVSTHIDSWEVESQNWTPRMREEFKSRRGYDLLSFLPVFTGRVVDSLEVSERFLWDLRQTVSELIVENYAGQFRRLANQNGMRLSIEAYDGAPVEDINYGGQADEPMAEFWRVGPDTSYSCTEMASAAHVYGKRILGAEAFTSTDAEKWLQYPGSIKDLGDWAFCEGINRFVFHRYAAQPWTNIAPGMSMGPWGLHYERTETWWEQSKAWHEYLARCQYLLQQGQFVADVCYLQPEGSPRRFAKPADAMAGELIRGGYNFDGCTAEVVVKRMTVKPGRIVLPDGMNYRVLVLPESETMTLPLIRKLKQLAEAGATIVAGAKRPQASPSLAEIDAGDLEVKRIADALWPKLIVGKTAAEVLGEQGVQPDFSSTPMLRHIHRSLGDVEVYFVANPEPRYIETVASFRQVGKRPEFWWPDSGRMAPALAFHERDGVTRVPLLLEPHGSLFVVWRKNAASHEPIVEASRDGQPQLTTTAKTPQIVVEKATYGILTDGALTRDVTAQVNRLVAKGHLSFRVAFMAEGDDPAYGKVKTLIVEYRRDGTPAKIEGTDPEIVSLLSAAPARESASLDICRGEFLKSGDYALKFAGGATRRIAVALPTPIEIAGPWEVRFPAKHTFDKLSSWSENADPAIRYFSGTASYGNAFTVEAGWLNEGRRLYLDLGQVAVMAEVKVNGRNLGVLWKTPYRVEVTDTVKVGSNSLEVNVVNLWSNRMIGDEQLPEDSDRNADGTLKRWPQWLLEGKPNPSGRLTFTTWRLWKKSDPLQPSGLLGPVTLRSSQKISLSGD